MRLKFHKRSAMKFVSRIIQSQLIGIGNYSLSDADGGFETQILGVKEI
jgi:hypothetical protein